MIIGVTDSLAFSDKIKCKESFHGGYYKDSKKDQEGEGGGDVGPDYLPPILIVRSANDNKS